jgi:hypothetical protein
MKLWQSKVGWACAGLYLATAAFLLSSQGLFGESFIAVFLGLPWSALLVLLNDFLPRQGSPLYLVGLYGQLLVPIALNAGVLYLIGLGIERLFRYLPPRRVYRKDGT